jgi:hypothetical protein
VNSTPGRFSNSIHTDSSHFDEFREFRRFCNPSPIRLNRSRVMGTSHAPCVSHAHTPDQESFGPSTPPLPGWQPEKEPPRLLKNETRDEEREGRDRSRKLLPSAARMLPLFPRYMSPASRSVVVLFPASTPSRTRTTDAAAATKTATIKRPSDQG